jgi:hypothetical protein
MFNSSKDLALTLPTTTSIFESDSNIKSISGIGPDFTINGELSAEVGTNDGFTQIIHNFAVSIDFKKYTVKYSSDDKTELKFYTKIGAGDATL